MKLANLLAACVPFVATLFSTNALAAPLPDDLAYASLAETFLESMGRNAEAPRQLATPDSILAENFLSASLGIFEVQIPVESLRDKETARDFKDICKALCQVQHEWLTWVGDGAEHGKEFGETLEDLEAWIGKWADSDLMATADSETRNCFELFQSKGDLSQRVTALNSAFRTAKVLGASAADEDEQEANQETEATSQSLTETPVKLVLMPERGGFVEFIAYAGWYLPSARGSFWHSGINTWSQFTLNDLNIIALQYASPTASRGDYTSYYSMKAKSPTGMEQQVAQLGLNELLAAQHGNALPPSLVSGLSINLITKIYGACHTRIDGDTSGKVTQKREVFVRGGQPEGGILPPNTAESRWRVNYGKDHYAPILKQAQRAGASSSRKSKSKYNAFQLVNEHGSQRYITRAPLLGPSGGEVEVVPDAVYGDYLEFTRAYQSAFLHWLQHHGTRSKKKSAQAFADFLSRIADGNDQSVSDIAEAVYGKPLSDEEASSKSLEGAFLKWLSKQ